MTTYEKVSLCEKRIIILSNLKRNLTSIGKCSHRGDCCPAELADTWFPSHNMVCSTPIWTCKDCEKFLLTVKDATSVKAVHQEILRHQDTYPCPCPCTVATKSELPCTFYMIYLDMLTHLLDDLHENLDGHIEVFMLERKLCRSTNYDRSTNYELSTS